MVNWQFTPYIILYIISVILSFTLFVIVIKTKPVRGKLYFSLMLLAIGIWILGYMLGFFNTNFQFKLIMLRFEYFGITCTPILWLFFVSSYTNTDKWLTFKARTLITIVPFLTFLQVLFVKDHQFFYLHYDLKELDNLIITDKIYGPGFYLWTSYSYLLVLAGIYILIRSLIKMPERFHRQVNLHLILVLIVIIPNALYIFGVNPIDPYDPICLSFVGVSILYMYIMKHHRFLDMVPVAHNLVFKNVKSGVLVTDNSLKIMDANPTSEIIFGKNIDFLIGKSIKEISSMFEGLLDKIKTNEEFITEISDHDEIHTYELQSTVLTDNNNKDIGRILMLYNITQRKQALKELNAYAHTVAHNLKNPMAALCGFSEILLEEERSSEENKEFLGYINESAYKMHSIIDGLLLLSKIRNNVEVETTILDMSDIIKQVLTRLKHTILRFEGEIKYPEIWPQAIGYPLWIEEIWINYITNALKYGGNPPVIELGAEKIENKVKFWVKDNGKGVSKEEQNTLFQEFTQLENKKSTEGYGLGLSIVKRIANKLNGDVGIESIQGKGSIFYFILPDRK